MDHTATARFWDHPTTRGFQIATKGRPQCQSATTSPLQSVPFIVNTGTSADTNSELTSSLVVSGSPISMTDFPFPKNRVQNDKSLSTDAFLSNLKRRVAR